MSIKWDIESARNYIEEKGYILLSNEYKNVDSELEIMCSEGHIFKMSLYRFKKAKISCSICRNKRTSQEMTFSYSYVKEYIESIGYKLLSDEYVNSSSPIIVECEHGHIYKTKLNALRNGFRCKKCQNKRLASDKALKYEEVKEYIESFGYKLLSTEYKNSHQKLKMVCENGHTVEMNLNNFKSNKRCCHCNISKGERRIIDWLKSNNIKYIYNEPYFHDLLSPLGNPLRPDFIIEDRKIWIEYDGEFHYKDLMGGLEKSIQYDEIKDKYAIENNWNLIRIPYWEFDDIKSILENKINKI